MNRERFAGYNDWRLPTLEEAMSLMEPKNSSGLYIDPVFNQTQEDIWTSDFEDASKKASSAWVVDFYHGFCNLFFTNYCVRAVR